METTQPGAGKRPKMKAARFAARLKAGYARDSFPAIIKKT
jgi:hypothetical protein